MIPFLSNFLLTINVKIQTGHNRHESKTCVVFHRYNLLTFETENEMNENENYIVFLFFIIYQTDL